jgi:hypothetical protein
VARFLTIALASIALSWGFLPVAAQVKAKDDEPKKPKREIKPCRDENGELLPLFRLYEVAGRKWMTKRKANPAAPGGDPGDIYIAYEVLEVREAEAQVRQTTLDQARRPSKEKPIEGPLKFDSGIPPFIPPPSWVKLREESLTVAAGKFDCIVYDTRMDNGTTWVSKDYPGLRLRLTDTYGTTEVIEFERFDSDKEARKPRPRPDEPDFTLFKTKKSWTYQVTSVKDGSSSTSFRKFEVSKAGATGCELKTTELNDARKPLKERPPEIKAIEFKAEFNDWVNPPIGCVKQRLERRKCAAGVLACDVYKYKDDQKREVTLWMARDLPGLWVLSRVGENGKEGGMELVELK